jgi:tripartite ATP-independent transporter DctP family solute receptor
MNSFLLKAGSGGKAGKKTFLRALVVVLIILAAGCQNKDREAQGAKPKVINVGHTGAKDHPYQMYLENWGKAVSEATDGRYVFEVFPSDLYGAPNQLIEGCQLGTSDMVLATGSLLAAYSSKVGVLNLPFLYEDSMQAYEVLNGPVGQEFDESLALKNLIVLGWWENGMRHLFPPRPVNGPDDLKGLKLRVVNSAEMIDTINAFGAIAVPMAFNDVYSAWQLKTIDGCEGTITHMLTQKYYELTKSGVLLWYMHVPNPLIMSKSLWDTIPESDRVIFLDEAKKMSKFSFEYQREIEEKEIQQCEAYGVVFTSPDREPFLKMVEPVYAKYRPQYGEILDKILAITRK